MRVLRAQRCKYCGFADSYAAQMDTLKRYRSKGQQTVRVERVTVESGGQAVVGNVETGGRGREGK